MGLPKYFDGRDKKQPFVSVEMKGQKHLFYFTLLLSNYD